MIGVNRSSRARSIDRPPFEPHTAQPLLVAAEAAAAALGLPELQTSRSGGASDANITAALGIPTVDGLGAIGAHPHARTEQVHTSSMPARAAFLAALADNVRTSH
jgi:glutamate carboxypeptidase